MNEVQIDNAQIRVLIVDDHDLFRTGLVSLFKSQRDIEVVGLAGGWESASPMSLCPTSA